MVFPTHVGVYLTMSLTAPEFVVFPTHVGVYRRANKEAHLPISFPHTRGGVPSVKNSSTVIPSFSPHTWGCTYLIKNPVLRNAVFPTHVGVYLLKHIPTSSMVCFPHTRGGVPHIVIVKHASKVVFPTHVGVYLMKV